MVRTRSRVQEGYDGGDSASSPHERAENDDGRDDVASRAEFEQLRRQNEELGRTLKEIMRIMKDYLPQLNIQTRADTGAGINIGIVNHPLAIGE